MATATSSTLEQAPALEARPPTLNAAAGGDLMRERKLHRSRLDAFAGWSESDGAGDVLSANAAPPRSRSRRNPLVPWNLQPLGRRPDSGAKAALRRG